MLNKIVLNNYHWNHFTIYGMSDKAPRRTVGVRDHCKPIGMGAMLAKQLSTCIRQLISANRKTIIQFNLLITSCAPLLWCWSRKHTLATAIDRKCFSDMDSCTTILKCNAMPDQLMIQRNGRLGGWVIGGLAGMYKTHTHTHCLHISATAEQLMLSLYI